MVNSIAGVGALRRGLQERPTTTRGGIREGRKGASMRKEPWPEAWPRGRRQSRMVRVTRSFGVERLPEAHRDGSILPMTIRLRAHAMEHPTLVLTGWAALHVLGLPAFCNDMPVEVVSRTNKRASSVRAVQHVKYDGAVPLADQTLFDSAHFELPGDVQAVCAEEALVRCLISVLKGRNAWKLPGMPDLCGACRLSAHEIRAVQLIDAVRRHIPLDSGVIAERARGRVSRRRLNRLWALSVQNADSPPETVLRLLVRDLLPDVAPQVPVYETVAGRAEPFAPASALPFSSADCSAGIPDDSAGILDDFSLDDATFSQLTESEELPMSSGGQARPWRSKILTRIDLASRKYWLALFYDGSHHNDPAQREHDAMVDRVLQARGATVLRFTASSMRDPFMVRRHVQQVIARAR